MEVNAYKMIYKFKSTLFFIFLFSSLSAQVTIGAFAGINSSKFIGDAPNNASYKSLLGINTGLLIDFELSDHFFLGIQPSYSQEGSRVFYKTKSSESAVDSVRIRLNYISFPVLFKALTANEHFYAIGGIEYAMLSSSFEKIEDVESDIPANVASWNLAMHFGAGVKLSLGVPNLFFELRYTQGLVNLTDTPIDTSNIPRIKTTGFKLLAGIEIPLKKNSEK